MKTNAAKKTYSKLMKVPRGVARPDTGVDEHHWPMKAYAHRVGSDFQSGLQWAGESRSVKGHRTFDDARERARTLTVDDWPIFGSDVSSNPCRKNPTKAQKREKAKKASAARRVALALAKFLKQANPAMKTTSATVTRLKGGGFTIRPIKAVKRR